MLLIAFLTLISSYIIGVMNGHHEAWLPTISELDEYSNPEGMIWTFGLTLAGILSIPVWLKLYGKWDRELRASNADRKWLRANLMVFVMTQLATVSFIWCVNFPLNKYAVPHGLTAGIYFFLVLTLGTIAILVVRKIDNYPKELIRIRLVLNIAGYASFILLGFFVPDGVEPLFMYKSLGVNHLHGVHAWTSFFEWMMVFTAQIGYFYTFNHDMKGESIIE